jgi:HEAT repeat protein
VQEAAISAIGEMRVLASSALGSLMPLLRNRRKWIRHAAVVSVGKIGPEAKRALPILRRLLRSSSLRTKNAIRQALGQIEGR